MPESALTDSVPQTKRKVSSWPSWVGLIPIGVAFAFMSWLTWRKWPDLLVDFGMQLYIPWKLSTGSLLYHDVAYIGGGPFSQYFNAALFKMFGPSLTVVITSNFLITLVLLFMVYRGFLACSNQLTATTICLAIVLVFAFSQFLDIGNYNYICPYSHELTHGLFLSVLSIAALASWIKNRRMIYVIIAGFCFGLVFMTKPEVFLALGAAVFAGFCLAVFEKKMVPWKSAVAFWISGVIPLVLFSFILASRQDWIRAARAVFWAWLPLLTTSAAKNDFHMWVLGMDAPALHIQKMIVHFAVICVVGCLCCWIFRLDSKTPAGRMRVIALVAGTAAAATFFEWMECGRSLPLITLCALGTIYWQHKSSSLEKERFIFPFLWLVFAVFMLLKMGVHTRIWHYGFALAMPAFVGAIYFFLWLLPRVLEKYGVRPALFQGTVLLVLVIGVFDLVAQTRFNYNKKNFPVGSNGDSIVVFDPKEDIRSYALNKTLEWVKSNVAPEKTLAVLPEGGMLNYLSRRSNSTAYCVFNLPEIQIFGQATMLRAYELNPPDYIILAHRDMAPPGAEVMNWIDANYQTVDVMGSEPFRRGTEFGVKILKRKL